MAVYIVAGGIGAGKSVVCRMLDAMEYPVYDCDRRAKAIMDDSPGVKRLIAEELHPRCICPDGSLNRPLIAEIVFSDKTALKKLNSLVHKLVTDDILLWEASLGGSIGFVETAIPYKSGVWRLAQAIIMVTAPDEIRISRAMARSGMTREAVTARIASQTATETAPAAAPPVLTVVNDNTAPVLPQVEAILQSLPAR